MAPAATIPAWPAIGSFVAVAGTLVLERYVLAYRDRPGATWFLGVLLAQSVWCGAYGVALLIFDPALRHHDGEGVERANGGPWATVTVKRVNDTLVVRADDSPGIPDADREPRGTVAALRLPVR